jgi:hypothetical protein
MLYDIIQDLSLTGNLVLCLDAADTRSYDGSSQTWTDASGNANNFFLGAGGTATATDPTFNGTAGVATEATYFSFDGGDYFTETTTHTFADGWHKDNGAFTIIMVVYIVDIAGVPSLPSLFSNGPNAADMDGFSIFVGNAEDINLARGITNTTVQITNAGTSTINSWNYVGFSVDEANLTQSTQLNATAQTVAATASTATDSNAQPLRICAYGDATAPIESGCRLACMAAWSTPISATALNEIYLRLKARRFTSLP